jgi:CRISPR system Cascade subunit CasB
MTTYQPTDDDFLSVYQNYHKLGNGDRAEIRRCAAIEDLKELPAFYRLLGSLAYSRLNQWSQVVWFLPHIERHQPKAETLGRQLKLKKISEQRIFHIVRASEPNDLLQLKRALQQAKLSGIDWTALSKTLFYWGKRQKQTLLRNYCLEPQTSTENKDHSHEQ